MLPVVMRFWYKDVQVNDPPREKHTMCLSKDGLSLAYLLMRLRIPINHVDKQGRSETVDTICQWPTI